MVYIKKIEIYGFKSFGFTNKVINLEKGLICITGPNGSGKSNILDAIAFALGENSPKALRVDKLHSLFYDNAPDKTRKNIRVSITFDNHDRGIPVDANIVTITREMPFDGDSIYLLNGKHVSKSTIIDLLDVALATPNKLNNVQQGMIMRIAEMNPEERRKILEDIIGLSYFDKKKEEALKQLEEADRRLEVALARMGEIRKRIEELELERNNQLRFHYLEKEIKRLNAIKISNIIRQQRKRVKELDEIIALKSKEYENLSKELESIKQQLSKFEELKDNVMKDVDKISKSKAEINIKISNLIVRLEQLKATKSASEQRIKVIGNTIPVLLKEKEGLKNRVNELEVYISKHEEESKALSKEKEGLSSNVRELNDRLGLLNKRLSDASIKQNKLEIMSKEKEELLANVKIRLASNTERLNVIQNNLEINRNKLENINIEINKLQSILHELENVHNEKEDALSKHKEEMDKLLRLKTMLTQYIDEAQQILEYANKITAKYDAKINVSKEVNTEEYTSLLLKEKNPKIIGVVRDLISYDERYAKAIIASAYQWLNAIVVKSVNDAIDIIEYAKSMNLPRINVIPLEIIEKLKFKKYNGKRLSEFVKTNYKHLADFVFDVYLASPSDAMKIAQEGYNAVTLEGQVFHANISSLRLNNITKLGDVTKLVILTKSVDELKHALSNLNDLVILKKEQLKSIEQRLEKQNNKIVNEQHLINDLKLQMENIKAEIERYRKSIVNLNERVKEIEKARDELINQIDLDKERETIVSNEIRKINEELNSIEKDGIINEINSINAAKNGLIKRLDEVENVYRRIITQLASEKAEYDNAKRRIDEINKELERIKKEARERRMTIINASKELVNVENELREARDVEQRIINTSANSVMLLKEYDDKIKDIREMDKKITKQLTAIEKDLAINVKEKNDLINSEDKLLNELANTGYNELIEDMDVELILKELIKEYDSIKNSINQLADKSYKQLIEGYKGVSERRNQLEEERNSIIRFIEDIDKEKRKIFMESFEKVDKDIRHIFATMTDNLGSAWLEIEDVDRMFEKGLALMIQFPGKPARESTSLSGGEKTIAAITFLLALQSLKSSPYYLFDEVDAHLDAQNTERLLKILVERANVSQMIVVTLKDIIVSHANLVYGVYAKNGVSNIIKYKNRMEMIANN